MTLGEFARSLSEEIAGCAASRLDVHGVIGEAAQLLEDLPAPQMQWFWQEVAGQLTAHRPMDDSDIADRLTSAIDEVLHALSACRVHP